MKLHEELEKVLLPKGKVDLLEILRNVFIEDEVGYIRGIDYPNDLVLDDIDVLFKIISIFYHSNMFSVPFYELEYKLLRDGISIGNLRIIYNKDFDYLDDFLLFD